MLKAQPWPHEGDEVKSGFTARLAGSKATSLSFMGCAKERELGEKNLFSVSFLLSFRVLSLPSALGIVFSARETSGLVTSFHTSHIRHAQRTQVEWVFNISTPTLFPLPGMSFPGDLEVEELGLSSAHQERREKQRKWEWSERKQEEVTEKQFPSWALIIV